MCERLARRERLRTQAHEAKLQMDKVEQRTGLAALARLARRPVLEAPHGLDSAQRPRGRGYAAREGLGCAAVGLAKCMSRPSEPVCLLAGSASVACSHSAICMRCTSSVHRRGVCGHEELAELVVPLRHVKSELSSEHRRPLAPCAPFGPHGTPIIGLNKLLEWQDEGQDERRAGHCDVISATYTVYCERVNFETSKD